MFCAASEQLYVLCWKIDVEDNRHNVMTSGYEWWLLQDYWTGNNGVIDTFLNPKPGVAEYIKQFNARSIFLQDGQYGLMHNSTRLCPIYYHLYGQFTSKKSPTVS